MNILFKENTFENITDALDLPSGTQAQKAAREKEFYAALPASLADPEKDWLWNYLQHCNKTGFGGWAIPPPNGPKWLPDAASSSW